METKDTLVIQKYHFTGSNPNQEIELKLLMRRKDNITGFEVWKNENLLLETNTRDDAQKFIDNLYFNRDGQQ